MLWVDWTYFDRLKVRDWCVNLSFPAIFIAAAKTKSLSKPIKSPNGGILNPIPKRTRSTTHPNPDAKERLFRRKIRNWNAKIEFAETVNARKEFEVCDF